ncbi:hypothetical protein C5C95_14955 [Rathayibacter sp. AY1B7]|uniref:hypothetical protein n=1 Tax=unclassified Rathayibacter TaxID=2609250 RepID=UPI000CE76D03|nr:MULTISPECIES: hypothetical protein [unclassified Rathayibacter]PPH86351.1 hypothetical protein C5C64_15310 [Rathayibacter sp. AY1D3]PPH95991.1 hypothetical protein C5C95_14955 [Rathayibacter sp. AY1B7]
MKVSQRLASLGAALALAGGLSVATATPALAADYNVSIAKYCADNVSSGTLAPSQATNINNRWDGWRCGTRYGAVGVNVSLACQQQHNSRAVAVTVNTSASGWRCRY